MALVRATPLLTTIAEVVALTGKQDLANLETGSEWTAADHLAKAHAWVYDRVTSKLGRGAPALLANQAYLERGVAARFLEVLYSTMLDDIEQRDYWGGQAREELANFVPEYSSGDEPARTEALPRVKNISTNPLFGSLK